MTSKRRGFSTIGSTPSSTNARWTRVRDPRAVIRFSLGDRVSWDDDQDIIEGTVEGYIDECTLLVRLDDGSTQHWPTIQGRLRRVVAELPEDLTVADAHAMAAMAEPVAKRDPEPPMPIATPSPTIYFNSTPLPMIPLPGVAEPEPTSAEPTIHELPIGFDPTLPDFKPKR